MKRKLLVSLTLLGSLVGLAGCNATRPDDSNVLSVLSDAAVYLYDFDDAGKAIEQAEADIASGKKENTHKNQKLIVNTIILKAWGDEKEMTVASKNWGWGDTLTQNLLAGFLAKDTPDIISGETQLPEFVAKGYVEPFPDELAEFIKTNVSPIAYKALEYEGKMYGISMTPSLSALFWNKKILRDCGISETIIENGPSNWTELEETMNTIHSTKDSKGNFYNAGGVYVGSGGVNYGAFLRADTLLASAGGSFVDETGKPNMVTTENETAYNFLINQQKYSASNMLNTRAEDNYFKYFNSGNMAYKIDGLWGLTEAKENNIEVGCCLMPTPDGTGERGTEVIGATYMAVSKFAKHKELAFEFIKLTLGEEIQKNIARGGYRSPVLYSAIEELGNKESEYYETYFDYYKTYADYAATHDARTLPSFVLKKGSRSNIWSAVGNSLAQTNNPRNTLTALQLLQNAQNTMIKEWNKG